MFLRTNENGIKSCLSSGLKKVERVVMVIFPEKRSEKPMYYIAETKIQDIADTMSKTEFESLKPYIHFNDNLKMPQRFA